MLNFAQRFPLRRLATIAAMTAAMAASVSLPVTTAVASVPVHGGHIAVSHKKCQCYGCPQCA
jgi:hypothetical protein